MKCRMCHKETEPWYTVGVLCEECAVKPRYRYYALLRPPGYACVPDGWCLREFWTPMRLISGDVFYAHGWVEYPQPLPMEEVWQFDFIPYNDNERETYRDWWEENRG